MSIRKKLGDFKKTGNSLHVILAVIFYLSASIFCFVSESILWILGYASIAIGVVRVYNILNNPFLILLSEIERIEKHLGMDIKNEEFSYESPTYVETEKE